MSDSTKVLAADKLLSRPVDIGQQTLTKRDTILYNLGIGCGEAAFRDEKQLRFVLEDRLASFPTMGAVLGVTRGVFDDPVYGIDYLGIVHGEEYLEIARPLPVEGKVVGKNVIDGVWDRGPGKGAIMRMKKTVHDAATDELLVTTTSILMLRFNGGYGGSSEGAPKAAALPETAPDGAFELPIRPEQALIYRLSGDDNPLHADPAVATKVGFPMPILHGLCSYAMAARALVQAVAGGDETRLKSFGLRFSSPVFPGETLRVEYWQRDGGEYAFRTKVKERDVVVQTGGRAVFAA